MKNKLAFKLQAPGDTVYLMAFALRKELNSVQEFDFMKEMEKINVPVIQHTNLFPGSDELLFIELMFPDHEPLIKSFLKMIEDPKVVEILDCYIPLVDDQSFNKYEAFLKRQFSKISINFWDDISAEDPNDETYNKTYCYVEEPSLDLLYKKQVLEFLQVYIEKVCPGISEMYFFDSREKYPELIGTEYEKTMFSRWEIHLNPITHEELENLVSSLQELKLQFQGVSLEIYSES